MAMSKRKPNYNPTFTMQELLTAVCDDVRVKRPFTVQAGIVEL